MITKLGERHEYAFQTTFYWFFPHILKKKREDIWKKKQRRYAGDTEITSEERNDVIDFQYVEIRIRPISSFSFRAE